MIVKSPCLKCIVQPCCEEQHSCNILKRFERKKSITDVLAWCVIDVVAWVGLLTLYKTF